MPKQPIDYSKTIMYRIVCKNPEIKDCYVGSTTDFKSRKQQHKNNCNRETSKEFNLKVYQFIRNNEGFENFNMLEIEKYKALDKPDQAKRERYWLEFYNATLNSIIPSRTHKEYYEENKEQIKEKIKVYCEQNIEHILKYQKEYYENNKEQIKEYNKIYYDENKEQIKEYYNKNAEEILKHKQEYYKKNKEQMNEKFTCSCGSIYIKRCFKKHELTKKHIK